MSQTPESINSTKLKIKKSQKIMTERKYLQLIAQVKKKKISSLIEKWAKNSKRNYQKENTKDSNFISHSEFYVKLFI